MSPRRRLLSIACQDWPAGDRAAADRATRPADGLYDEAGGAAEGFCELTLRKRWEAYEVWLSFLDRTGELDPSLLPAARVTPARLDAWIADQRGRRNCDTTIYGRIIGLHQALLLLQPGAEVRFILRPAGLSLRAALRPVPRPFTTVDSREILRRALELFEAGRAGRSYARGGTAIRDAALLGLLAAHAPRIGSLAAMRIGVQLKRMGDGYSLEFGEADTKNRRSLTLELLPELVPVFDFYIHQVRSRCVAGCRGSDALWAGTRGRPLSARGLTKVVQRRTAEWFGKAEGPHWFRKCLRSTAARLSPEAALDAAAVMGHSQRISVAHYAEAGSGAALRRHGTRITRLRRATRLLAERSYAERAAAEAPGADNRYSHQLRR
ncbi:MAG TPA: hypothetical protein VGN83_04790 [Falsiroseomonas sp.]|jgi:hypothetical protein|nr:hypothetical protein [Falsiroseomonas sp.]